MAPESRHQAADHKKVYPGDIATGVIIGRISEFFDFFVFGIASVLVFPSVFFPFVGPLAGTLYSFAVFSLAFIARPFGSLVFIAIQRVHGRSTKLTIALFMLGTATAGIAFLPTYSLLGMHAILLLVAFRLAQGFALGGTWDGLPSLLSLTAPRERRGWYAMIPQLGAPLGFALAAGLFAYLISALSQVEFLDWGWRFPFYVAFAINVVALFARLRMVMTPEFDQLLESSELEPSPVSQLLEEKQGVNIVLGAFAPLASFALFHLVTIFPLSWVTLLAGASVREYLIVQLAGAFVCVVTMLISGGVADRIGRRKVLSIGAGLIAAFALVGMLPLFQGGTRTGAYLFILVGFALLGFVHAQSSGAINSRFSSRNRFTGAMLTSDLAWLIGAAFAPLVALSIASDFGVGFVGLYLLSGAVCSAAALMVTRSLEMRED